MFCETHEGIAAVYQLLSDIVEKCENAGAQETQDREVWIEMQGGASRYSDDDQPKSGENATGDKTHQKAEKWSVWSGEAKSRERRYIGPQEVRSKPSCADREYQDGDHSRGGATPAYGLEVEQKKVTKYASRGTEAEKQQSVPESVRRLRGQASA